MTYDEFDLEDLRQDLAGRWFDLRAEQRRLAVNPANREEHRVVSDWLARVDRAREIVKADARRGWNSSRWRKNSHEIALADLLDLIEVDRVPS